MYVYAHIFAYFKKKVKSLFFFHSETENFKTKKLVLCFSTSCSCMRLLGFSFTHPFPSWYFDDVWLSVVQKHRQTNKQAFLCLRRSSSSYCLFFAFKHHKTPKGKSLNKLCSINRKIEFSASCNFQAITHLRRYLFLSGAFNGWTPANVRKHSFINCHHCTPPQKSTKDVRFYGNQSKSRVK